MKGFDPEFQDLDQYIRVITARIWEGRRIDDIRRYYSDPCTVETPSSVSTTVEEVVSGTRATLATFPDRRLLAEDIIVSGDEDGGFLSSHRLISPMTHLGDGEFGAPSGRKVHVRTIADCVCKDNRVVHEWLVRDEAAIARAIGIEPRALAQTWLDQSGGWDKPVAGPAPAGYRSHISSAAPARAPTPARSRTSPTAATLPRWPTTKPCTTSAPAAPPVMAGMKLPASSARCSARCV